MAAQGAGMRNGLAALVFTDAAAAEVVIGQGYDSFDPLLELTDSTILDLVSTIRKPSGMIPNPAVPPVPLNIPNPGINIGHRAATNLKLAAFVVRHYERTSRPLDNPVATLGINNLCSYISLKNAEDAYTDPDSPPVLEKVKRIRDHIKTLGMVKAPLAYIVRPTDVVPPSAQDLSNNYDTIQEEMVSRMPHTHIAYRQDNIKVWEMIRDSLHETEAFNWIKRSKRSI
jgi:hypothetical protein